MEANLQAEELQEPGQPSPRNCWEWLVFPLPLLQNARFILSPPCCKIPAGADSKLIKNASEMFILPALWGALGLRFYNTWIETKERSEKRRRRSLPKQGELWFQKMNWHWASGVGAALITSWWPVWECPASHTWPCGVIQLSLDGK